MSIGQNEGVVGLLKEKDANWITRLIVVIAIAFSAFHIYTAIFGLFGFVAQRGVHLAFGVTLVILQLPLARTIFKRKFTEQPVMSKVLLGLDVLLILLFWASVYVARWEYLKRLDNAGSSTFMAIVAGGVMLFVVLEAARRKVGLILPFLAVIAVIYAWAGPHMPNVIMHKGYSLERIFTFLAVNVDGMFGITMKVSSTIIFMFVLFGAFLETAGANEFVNKFALAITGKRRSGPAMAAVIASALMGTINGSAVANVVGTGSFTIPLMKSRGYKGEFAAGVESVASTGGQILPPVMGAGAFIMVAFTKISYTKIILAATIPAMLYFFSVGMGLVFRSMRRGLQGLPEEELPNLKESIKSGLEYIPVIVILIYALLIAATSPMMAAFYATIAIPVFAFFRKEKRFNLKRIFEGMRLAGQNALTIVIGCACAGIIVAMVALTGLGVAFSDMMLQLSGGNLFLTLFFTAIACIILGMGLPTTAAYVITAAIIAPALERLGVPILAAHLFVFYYACLSAITPPVALAAYAGAGIAKSNPMATAIEACKLGIVGFIVPFMFVYNGVLLANGTVGQIIFVVITAMIGVTALVSGVQNYLLRGLNIIERLLLIAGGLTLIKPGTLTDTVGLLLIAAVVVYQIFTRSKPETVLNSNKSVEAN